MRDGRGAEEGGDWNTSGSVGVWGTVVERGGLWAGREVDEEEALGWIADADTTRAKPKSHIFRLQSSLRRMLAGLRSRWITAMSEANCKRGWDEGWREAKRREKVISDCTVIVYGHRFAPPVLRSSSDLT